MNGTHYLATAWIDEHLLRFTALPFQARLRITFGGIGSQPEALGSVIGLDSDEPGLRVSAPLHVEWATLHSEAIITEASVSGQKSAETATAEPPRTDRSARCGGAARRPLHGATANRHRIRPRMSEVSRTTGFVETR